MHVVNMLDSSVFEGEFTPLKCYSKSASKSPSLDARSVSRIHA
jgi:hypothetical protein